MFWQDYTFKINTQAQDNIFSSIIFLITDNKYKLTYHATTLNNSTTSALPTQMSVLQGDSLSCFLFNIYTNELFTSNQTGVEIV